MYFVAGENIGVHEGPRENGLMTDASPYIEALLFTYTPNNFLSYYPAIPYSKGASVWGMLEAFWDAAGPDAFQVSSCRISDWQLLPCLGLALLSQLTLRANCTAAFICEGTPSCEGDINHSMCGIKVRNCKAHTRPSRGFCTTSNQFFAKGVHGCK